MNCDEQVAMTFDTLKKMSNSGLGDIVIGILNNHPEIKSTDRIPGTEQTLNEYIQEHYPSHNIGDLMPKNTLLKNLNKHDAGEHINVNPLAEKTGKDLNQILTQDGACKQAIEMPLLPLGTPQTALNNPTSSRPTGKGYLG